MSPQLDLILSKGMREMLGPQKSRHTLLALLFAVSFTGSPEGSVAQTSESRNIDGLPKLVLRETLRIGSVESADSGFSRIGPVAVDRDSQIFVVETMDLTIRVFSSEGVLLRTFGGEGEGPGEFGRIAYFGVTGDTVWALDPIRSRITFFDRQGKVLSTGTYQGIEVPIQDQVWNGVVTPTLRGSDGLFMGRMHGMRRRTEPNPNGIGAKDTVAVPLIRFAASGEVVDTVGWEPYPPPRIEAEPEVEVRGSNYRVPRPPSGEPIKVDMQDGQWIIDAPLPTSGDETSFWVTRRNLRGETLFRRSYRYRPRRYTSEVLDSIAFRTTPRPATVSFSGPPQTMSTSAVRAVQRAIRGAMDFPRFQPPIRAAWAGQDGTLWLQREENGGPAVEWILFRPDGEPIGTVALPRDWSISCTWENELMIQERDEFDVPWLVRFTFEPER